MPRRDPLKDPGSSAQAHAGCTHPPAPHPAQGTLGGSFWAPLLLILPLAQPWAPSILILPEEFLPGDAQGPFLLEKQIFSLDKPPPEHFPQVILVTKIITFTLLV